MKTINVFVADDGSRFDDDAKCAEYEKQCAACAEIMARLPPKYDDGHCDFANGAGYIQHDATTLREVRDALTTLFESVYGPSPLAGNNWYAQDRNDHTVHASWVGRLIGDCGHRAFNAAWYRIYCCDSKGREWGQPYYASHTDEGKQFDVYAAKNG